MSQAFYDPFEGMGLEEIRYFANDYTSEKMAARGIDQDWGDWKSGDVVAACNYEDFKLCIVEMLDEEGEPLFSAYNQEGRLVKWQCSQHVRVYKARKTLTSLQAADLLDVTQRRIQALVRAGKLHPMPTPHPHLLLLDEQEVRCLAESERKAGRPAKGNSGVRLF